MAAKLQASFFHVFCLFHNNPPITQTSIPSAPAPKMPLSPRDGNGQTRRDPTSLQSGTAKRTSKTATLRDPVPSYTSEASYLTNPYASVPPGTAISPPRDGVEEVTSASRRSPAAPPGLAPIRQPTPSSSFIFPAQNFIPATSSYFNLATDLATQLLSGSHPLRLSVAIEHAAFIWDCIRDGDGSRAMARRAIRDCHAAKEGLSDADFEDAAECVGVLGRMMRREGLSGSPSLSRRSVGSSRSTVTPRAPQTATSRRGASAMTGSGLAPDRSPTSTRSSPRAVRSHGRRTGSDGPSSAQGSPTRSRASRGSPGGGHRQSGSGGTTKALSGRERKGSHSTKGSGSSAKSRSDDSKENIPRGATALRGSGVTRGDRTSRSRNISARGLR